MAFIVGTFGPDDLLGTIEDDLILGLPGNDTLLGLAGRDALFAGSGNDTVNGEQPEFSMTQVNASNDVRSLVTENDFLDGGRGDDVLVGDIAEVNQFNVADNNQNSTNNLIQADHGQ